MDFLTLSLDSQTPLYQQLYEYIKTEIQAGRIAYNAKLPSKRKLSAHLGISQNTVQAAYDQLIEEGYVIPSERRGFFVSRLENLHRLETRPLMAGAQDSASEADIRYDFSVDGVDHESFPFDIWRKLMKEVITEYDRDILMLGESQGYYPLRRSIAAYLRQSRGVRCSEDQIIISAGTEFLLQLLVQLLDKDSLYGLEDPGYERLSLLFKNNGVEYRPIPIDEEGMIPEAIENSGVHMIYVAPAHQFPSGNIMPINRRLKLLNWASSAEGRYIIEDDYDSEFKYSGRPIPALQGLDILGKVIYMGSFSKSLSPATRISYMVLPQSLLGVYKERLSYFLCPVPGIDQRVLHRFISEGYFEKHLNKMRTLYKKKREVLVRALRAPVEVLGADAGLHILLRIHDRITEDELVASALKRGVRVYGLSRYAISQRTKEAPSVVLGFAALSEADIKKAVIELEKAWCLG